MHFLFWRFTIYILRILNWVFVFIILIIMMRMMAAKPSTEPFSHCIASVPVDDHPLQDGMEQRPPFFRVPGGIFVHQFTHGILQDIQRIIPVSCRDLSDSKSALFYLGKKTF
jgi:hypothetical protein